jgi:hypothetical protein
LKALPRNTRRTLAFLTHGTAAGPVQNETTHMQKVRFAGEPSKVLDCEIVRKDTPFEIHNCRLAQTSIVMQSTLCVCLFYIHNNIISQFTPIMHTGGFILNSLAYGLSHFEQAAYGLLHFE